MKLCRFYREQALLLTQHLVLRTVPKRHFVIDRSKAQYVRGRPTQELGGHRTIADIGSEVKRLDQLSKLKHYNEKLSAKQP